MRQDTSQARNDRRPAGLAKGRFEIPRSSSSPYPMSCSRQLGEVMILTPDVLNCQYSGKTRERSGGHGPDRVESQKESILEG